MENPENETKPRRYRWLVITIIGILIIVGIAALSAFGGYRSGIKIRTDAESTQIVGAVQEQYLLGLQDIQQGQYIRARQRFEYVISLDPDYPGATEKLSEVLLKLNSTATPTTIVTPTLTPTPDNRAIEERYNQAQTQIANNDWSAGIESLLMLRKEDPNFRPIDVDGLLFIALRNRGVDKILTHSDLEGGLYDLALAENFGPLDTEAQSFKNFAGLYITGASFWGLDYLQAAEYFSQVAPHMPNLRDGSGLTAAERYRQALIEYGYQLIREGRCSPASEQFRAVLAIYNDPTLETEFSAAVDECEVLRSKGPQNP